MQVELKKKPRQTTLPRGAKTSPQHTTESSNIMAKWVYTFGDGAAEGAAEMRNLLGGEGANLAEMANRGLPVPPGFTISTEVCTYFYANNKTYPKELEAQVK